ncbi:MAG: ferrochelatase [Pirellulaceae bacterium]|nr:ferrochelatase [Pirellulaceae bacterium]
MTQHSSSYDALILVSFGGPERPEDVIPFLENVLRGKRVPRERLLEVAEHYYHFDGVSPINAQNRALIAAIQSELEVQQIDLPVYWGNRNWHPMLPDTLREMKKDGVRTALGFVTSAFSSYSGCRQYRENINVAQEDVGEGAPLIDKLRVFYNHPRFIRAVADRIKTALIQVPTDRHASTLLVYTAHSIPESMAQHCQYVPQLQEASRLATEAVGSFDSELVYQSRSGPPTQPWLEPDVGDALRAVHATGKYTDVVIIPIGFLSDHMEVLFDLDFEVKSLCQEIGFNMVRAETVGVHPEFVGMIVDLILERTTQTERLAIGQFGPQHDECPVDCCESGRKPT